jgi:transcriptional regulator with XRE-family HTH domain
MGDISNLKIDIGKAIRNGLEKHHMIQRDLAEMLGKSVSLVSEWTRNVKVPSGDDLIRVAILLDIVEELFPGYTKGASSVPKIGLVTRDEFESLRKEVEEFKKQPPLYEAHSRYTEERVYHPKFPKGLQVHRNLDTDEVFFDADDIFTNFDIKPDEVQPMSPALKKEIKAQSKSNSSRPRP